MIEAGSPGVDDIPPDPDLQLVHHRQQDIALRLRLTRPRMSANGCVRISPSPYAHDNAVVTE